MQSQEKGKVTFAPSMRQDVPEGIEAMDLKQDECESPWRPDNMCSPISDSGNSVKTVSSGRGADNHCLWFLRKRANDLALQEP